ADGPAARQPELLPVPYSHVVFTLPPAAAEIAFQNKQTVYALLMRVAAEALMMLAAERLRAQLCLSAVFRPRRGRHPRRPAMGRLQTQLPALRPRSVEDIPPALPGPTGDSLSPRRARLLRRTRPARQTRRLRRARLRALARAPRRLCQAAVRWTRARAGLSRPLHAS